MNGHSVVFGQLVQKSEQITPNSSILQDDQNEWSQYSIQSWDVLGLYKIDFNMTGVKNQLTF